MLTKGLLSRQICLVILALAFFDINLLEAQTPACGDGVCTLSGESSATCPEDCGPACPSDGMVGWWRAEGNASDFYDSLDGNLVWVDFGPGKVGQGFDFNDGSSYVSLPSRTVLDSIQEGSFSFEAWYKPNSIPPGTDTNTLAHGILIKPGHHMGIKYDQFGRFVMEHWLTGNVHQQAASLQAYSPWEFHHVVGVVDRPRGKTRVYVDGELGNETSFAAGTASYRFGVTAMRIGVASPGASVHRWATDGVVDEVVIYNRALEDFEVRANYEAGSYGLCTKPPLTITTESLPPTKLGDHVSHQLEAENGVPPYSWELTGGELPSDLTLSSSGIMNGIPHVAGEFSIIVRVTDADGRWTEESLSLQILATISGSQIKVKKFGTLPVPGRTLDYFILIENTSSTPVENVEVFELLEPWFYFESAVPDPTAFIPTTFSDGSTSLTKETVVFWNIPILLPGRSTIVSYKARLSRGIPVGFEVTGLACGGCGGGGGAGGGGGPNGAGLSASEAMNLCKAVCAVNWVGQVFGPPPVPNGPEDACATCVKGVRNVTKYICRTNKKIEDAFKEAAGGMPGGDGCGGDGGPVKRPLDPNEKLVLAEKFMQPDQTLVYPTHFENIGDIEALDVFVSDELDPRLDLTSIEVLAPDGQFHALEDGETLLLEEDQQVTLNGRSLRWELYGRNLPPGDTGEVVFLAKPLEGLPSGTEIRNEATIQFEIFETITTNQTLNVIDGVSPECTMTSLPNESGPDVLLSWSGLDPIGEVESYSILVSEDGGGFAPYLTDTGQTQAMFTGEVGSQYGFICLARDTAGNVEVQAPLAETITAIVATEDSDGDAVLDDLDNCPHYPNRDQLDLDGDGFGLPCDAQVCGNGVLEIFPGDGFYFEEECDDGNTFPGDGCSSDCQLEPRQICGNDLIEGDEICDGFELSGQTCQGLGFTYGELGCLSDCTDFDASFCTNNICGNDILDPDEDCDDGNLASGDGCSMDCNWEDLDGDGYYSYLDCDDQDPTVNPDAIETCNGIDDNCDGLTDDVDDDGDGVLDCSDDLCLGSILDQIDLNPNQYAQNLDFGPFEVGPRNDQSVVYDMTVTGGCTCRQIVQTLDAGKGHLKKGCSSGIMEEWTGVPSEPDREAGIGKK